MKKVVFCRDNFFLRSTHFRAILFGLLNKSEPLVAGREYKLPETYMQENGFSLAKPKDNNIKEDLLWVKNLKKLSERNDFLVVSSLPYVAIQAANSLLQNFGCLTKVESLQAHNMDWDVYIDDNISTSISMLNKVPKVFVMQNNSESVESVPEGIVSFNSWSKLPELIN